MSLTGDRAAIAAALSTVEGVTGHEYRPSTAKAGDAWPLWGGSERADAQNFFVTWRVIVVTPQDERAASDWVDARTDEFVDALLPVGYVDRIEPVAVATGGGDQKAIQITMRSE